MVRTSRGHHHPRRTMSRTRRNKMGHSVFSLIKWLARCLEASRLYLTMFCTGSFAFFFFFSYLSLSRKKSKREVFSVVRVRGPDTFISDEQSQPEPFRMLFREICILETRDVLGAKVSRSC